MNESTQVRAYSVNKMVCYVRNCESAGYKSPNITFHRFPKAAHSFVNITNKLYKNEKIDRLSAWKRALLLNQKLSCTNKRICSLHFKEEDYPLQGRTSTVKRLKNRAVPARNLPKDDDKAKVEMKQKNNERTERLLQREEEKTKRIDSINHLDSEKEPSVENEGSADLHVNGNAAEENFSAPLALDQTVDEHENTNTADKDDMGSLDFETKKMRTDEDVISNMITNEKELNTVTGIPNFEVLQTLMDIASIVAPHMESYSVKLSARNRIIMAFMKLKQNLSYALLAVIFKLCSVENCRKTVFRMLDVLSSGLKSAIPWPSKAEVSKNIPFCFLDFMDVRVVIDCIEIFIEKPKNLCCQLATYSHYKSTYTTKFMTGVSPGGIITFVSDAYGGRSSDKAIFEQSCMIKLLEKNDAIMTDKGFLIDDICRDNDIKLIRPTFLRNKKQFSAQEALLNAKIAKARVHVERSNQRLKMFKILGSKVPSALVPRMEQIITIISAVVNLSSSIIGDDKFHC